MKFLYLDTSYRYCRLAILEENACPFIKEIQGLKGMENTVFQYLEELKQTGFNLEELDAFVVLKGPGSFTGLRIGMSIMKTLAYALKKPLIGLSTLAVHSQMLASYSEGEDCILTLMDARNERAFGRLQQGKTILIDDVAQSLSFWAEKAAPFSEQLLASLETAQLLPDFSYKFQKNTLEHYDYKALYLLCKAAYLQEEKDPFKQTLSYLAPTQVERLQNIHIELEEGIEFL